MVFVSVITLDRPHVSPAERDWAERVVAAFAAQPDAGTLALDGKMIDRPHLLQAQRLLQQAKQN